MNSDTVADRVAALFHGSRGEHTRNALHEALVGCLGGVDGTLINRCIDRCGSRAAVAVGAAGVPN